MPGLLPLNQSSEITLPFGWNLFATAATVVVVVVVIAGVALTLLDKRPVTVSRKIVWTAVEIVLPIIGLVLWLLIEGPPKVSRNKKHTVNQV